MESKEKMMADVLADMLANGSIESVYYGYSGRCMYGETCTGVVVNHKSDGETMLALAISALSLFEQFDATQFLLGISEVSSDHLGKSRIIYFPNFDLEDPENS